MKKFNDSFLKEAKARRPSTNFKDFRIHTKKTLEEISEVSESEDFNSVTQTYNEKSSYLSSSRLNSGTEKIKVSSYLRKFLTRLQTHEKVYFFFYRNASTGRF